MYMDISQEQFYARIYGKKTGPKTGKTPLGTLCANLHNRSAHKYLRRASYGRIYSRTSQGPDGAPWSNPGLNSYLYRENPSVWTHCLGKKWTTGNQLVTSFCRNDVSKCSHCAHWSLPHGPGRSQSRLAIHNHHRAPQMNYLALASGFEQKDSQDRIEKLNVTTYNYKTNPTVWYFPV